MWFVAFDEHISVCYGAFVGHVYELVLVLDAYASYIHFELKCTLCHVAATIWRNLSNSAHVWKL